MRESGLKLCESHRSSHCLEVSPYAGEWIEICLSSCIIFQLDVSPYAGEWIEMCSQSLHLD